ncbi:adhesion G protein-coupled receptor F5-like [Spea bombifrons]|uniref:adhesion G protein-coupled receptor F5-like n=1 Tax=Spea bombifrons TaxID=233779 RepID=UPI0023491211|nr:adhesion G protein-coupled receptor F5-like [Spea bombifrons]
MCLFSGTSTSVSWLHESTRLLNGSRNLIINNEQNTILTINNVSMDDAGTYTCDVTAGGESQVQKIPVKITKLEIITTADADVVCNNTKLELTCCSEDIRMFGITWEISGSSSIAGTSSSNSSCGIYTITASETQCRAVKSGSATNYTCVYQGIYGARGTRVISVTYLRIANVTVRAEPVSVGKTLKITCESDTDYTKIMWAKDRIDSYLDDRFSNKVIEANATMSWSGVYFCFIHQKHLRSIGSANVTVVPLPKLEEIQVEPLDVTRLCNSWQRLTCCFKKQDCTVRFIHGNTAIPGGEKEDVADQVCYKANYNVNCDNGNPQTAFITCEVTNRLNDSARSRQMIIRSRNGDNENKKSCTIINEAITIPHGTNYSVLCMRQDPNQVGNITYTCNNGELETRKDCYSARLYSQLLDVQNVVNSPQPETTLPAFIASLSDVSSVEKGNISSSAGNIDLMVNIITTVSSINTTVKTAVMENFITAVNVVVDNATAWQSLKTQSSRLLLSVEEFVKKLEDINSFETNGSNSNIQLKGNSVNSSTDYEVNFALGNMTGEVLIKKDSLSAEPVTIISVAYSTMKDILPPENGTFLNALVVSTVRKKEASFEDFSILMTFTKSNSSLVSPQCVFWDVTLGQAGGWNKISPPVEENGLVICTSNHLTSFSVLMSEKSELFLDIITYAGVGISLVCLFITLVIEAMVWRSVIKNKTSYLRHICLVNVAVSLLVADIWFIIGAFLEKHPESNACLTAAFFSFFFYLALFFWMLTMGLLVFYRMIYILHDMSRKTMIVVAFTLGYGCPLVISVITVASTAPSQGFTSKKFCWLDYNSTKTFLAFVIPALTIVFINFMILVVVIIKLLRPSIGERPGKDDRSILIQIAKSIAVLTPLLGITWGFGLGVVLNPYNTVLHGIFAALNSFQGLFILISTVILDQKVRMAVGSSMSWSYWSTLRTKVLTSSTNSSAPSRPRQKNLFPKRGVYNVFTASSSNELSTDSYSVLS